MYGRLHVQLQRSHRSITASRDLVAGALHRYGPCSIKDICDALQGRVSQATIYRTIRVFLDVGVAEMIRQDVIRLRPPFRQDSHFMVCEECGREIAFNYASLEQALERAAASRDFAMSHHRVELYGRCGVCRGIR